MTSPTSPGAANVKDLMQKVVAAHRDCEPSKEIFSRNWCSEHKRLLYQQDQRHWLRSKSKHHYIDFSDEERAELRRYFDALANESNRIGLQSLENMLISLGLADTRLEVQAVVDSIDDNGNGELDFEEYLEIFRKRTDSEIYQVFKAMMEGKLGDQNLNFQTVISTYRRNLFIDATGAGSMRPVRLPSDNLPLDQGTRILHNFANLQRNRYAEAQKDFAAGNGPPLPEDAMSFDLSGHVPPGNLGMAWRTVTNDHGLVSSRPSSAERSKSRLCPPQSPRTVINSIVKAPKTKKRPGPHGSTVVIYAPALQEGRASGVESPSSAKSP